MADVQNRLPFWGPNKIRNLFPKHHVSYMDVLLFTSSLLQYHSKYWKCQTHTPKTTKTRVFISKSSTTQLLPGQISSRQPIGHTLLRSQFLRENGFFIFCMNQLPKAYAMSMPNPIALSWILFVLWGFKHQWSSSQCSGLKQYEPQGGGS